MNQFKETEGYPAFNLYPLEDDFEKMGMASEEDWSLFEDLMDSRLELLFKQTNELKVMSSHESRTQFKRSIFRNTSSRTGRAS